MQIFLVGGAVRDRLLGLAVTERDWVVVGATPQQMLDDGFVAKDDAFPVFTHPDTGDEYALARRESKRGHGHKGFVLEFGPEVRLDEDLARRDLTVNAMAEDATGAIIDPWGGRDALRARVLRHVTPAFEEDPLRVLRLARFAAQLGDFDFAVDSETARIASRMSAGGALSTLSGGRIWRETEKALAAPRPERYFVELARYRALRRLFPAVDPPGADPGAGRWPAVDALVAAGAADPGVRLAAFGAAPGGGAQALLPSEWPVPRDIRDLLALVASNPPPYPLDADDVLAWLHRVDALRRAARFERALAAWRAIGSAPQAALDALRRCADAARAAPAPAPGPGARTARRRAERDAVSAALEHAA